MDGKYLLSGSDDGHVFVIDGRASKEFKPIGYASKYLVWHIEKELWVIGCFLNVLTHNSDKYLHLWNSHISFVSISKNMYWK